MNVTFGGFLYTPTRAGLLQASKPYLQDVTFFCFKEHDAYSAFDRFTSPFQYFVWIIMGALLCVATIIILLTKKLSRKWRHFYIGGRLNRTPILNMYLTALGLPINNPRIAERRYFSTFARTILLLWIMLWLLIRSGYQSILYKHLRGERFTSAFNTIHKIQESDCKIIVPPLVKSTATHLFSENR